MTMITSRRHVHVYVLMKIFFLLICLNSSILSFKRTLVYNTITTCNSRYITSLLSSSSPSSSAAASDVTITNKYVYNELSEKEVDDAMALALGEEHTLELSKKVTAALEDDYDVQQGVNPNRLKPLPLKANIDLWSYNARQHFLNGSFAEATRIYKQCIDYNPVDGRPWLGLARIYHKKGQYVFAEKAYKEGLYYNPKNPYLLQSWAVMLEKSGQLQQATNLLLVSVKSNPKHAASWVALANIKRREGDIESARSYYSNAIKGDSRNYVALQAWGVLEYKSNNIDKARDLFQRSVIASNSKSAYAYQAWSKLEIQQGKYQEAKRILNQALAAWPKSTRIRLVMAELSELMGDIDGTRVIFSRGENYASSCGDAGYFQSWALFEIRQNSRLLYNTFSNDDIDDSNSSGSSSSSSSNNKQVFNLHIRRLFKKAITINKQHSASWMAWAKHEQKLNNPEIARKLLITGISKFPHSKNIGWFHCSLGNLAFHSNDYNTAKSCYSRALEATAPQDSLPVILEFAQCEGKFGYVVEARKLYELAVRRFPSNVKAWSDYIKYESKRTDSSAVVSMLLERKKILLDTDDVSSLSGSSSGNVNGIDSGSSGFSTAYEDEDEADASFKIDKVFNYLLDEIYDKE